MGHEVRVARCDRSNANAGLAALSGEVGRAIPNEAMDLTWSDDSLHDRLLQREPPHQTAARPGVVLSNKVQGAKLPLPAGVSNSTMQSQSSLAGSLNRLVTMSINPARTPAGTSTDWTVAGTKPGTVPGLFCTRTTCKFDHESRFIIQTLTKGQMINFSNSIHVSSF